MPPPSTKTQETAPVTTVSPAVAPVAPAPVDQPPDNSAEVKKLRDRVAELEGEKKKITTTIRKLAAAILTPIDEADKGVARAGKIREGLESLTKVLTPEE